MSYLITIVSFMIVFGVLVTVHEYGHMFFAKRAGIMCPEFAIGMGPKIFSFRKNETLYTIRLLPVGGYVRMAGDGLEEPPVEPGMNVKVKLNDKDEITHIILDDQHKFQKIEELKLNNVTSRMICTLKVLLHMIMSDIILILLKKHILLRMVV